MGYYINCIKSHGALSRDIKELVPQMNMRRRMSRVVKMGVTTALDSLLDFDAQGVAVDAIVSATGLGCIADSEKFLNNIITCEERMLNPTPFIQSTFNTVGAQVALLRGLHCYNNTLSQRHIGLESALLDAQLRIDMAGANAVLVVVFDETTPAIEVIKSRLGLLNGRVMGEGAYAFVVTRERLDSSVASIEELSFDVEVSQGDILVSEHVTSYWHGATTQVLCESQVKGGSVVIINDMDGGLHSKISLIWF